MKCRIVKVEADKPYFIVQIKKWCGWRTFQDSGCDGWDIYYYDGQFDSAENAEKFIAKNFMKPKLTIIKEIILLLVLCCFSSAQ